MATAISRFFNTTFNVQRMQSTGGASFGTAWGGIGTFLGHIQQANAEYIQNLGFTFTRGYTVWCPVGTNVQVGDKLTVASINAGLFEVTAFGNAEFGNNALDATYNVRAITEHTIGDNQHLELLIARDEESLNG